jgi:hypothetical protein
LLLALELITQLVVLAQRVLAEVILLAETAALQLSVLTQQMVAEVPTILMDLAQQELLEVLLHCLGLEQHLLQHQLLELLTGLKLAQRVQVVLAGKTQAKLHQEQVLVLALVVQAEELLAHLVLQLPLVRHQVMAQVVVVLLSGKQHLEHLALAAKV